MKDFIGGIASVGILVLLLQACITPQSQTTPSSKNEKISSTPISLELSKEQPQAEMNNSEINDRLAFDWPVDQARMTRGFLPKKKRPHWGIDLAAPKGTQIFSSHDGMVVYTGRAFHGYGKMVLIENGHGWASIYAHLDKIVAHEGQIIRQGDLVGLMGRTGRATGVHLHFEIRRDKGPVDPLTLLPKIPYVASSDIKESSHEDHEIF